MTRLILELDEKFYNNKPINITFKLKVHPYIDRKHPNMPEAQDELADVRKSLMEVFIAKDLIDAE